jgi:DNA protecting protein DprA
MLLRRTDSAPPLIAVRGNLLSLQRSKIAVIGARNASASGLALAAQLARAIGRAGHVIVSGLARGIDARAHQTAIETGTIAVVAGGLGNIYPAEHQNLLEQILEEGAAISEMPFGWEARGRDFPRRNRIVAGLSRAVLVVEAARRSGSLITARFAAEQGREVFAVPGFRSIRVRKTPTSCCATGRRSAPSRKTCLMQWQRRSLRRKRPATVFSVPMPRRASTGLFGMRLTFPAHRGRALSAQTSKQRRVAAEPACPVQVIPVHRLTCTGSPRRPISRRGSPSS